jgi:hypothetical protein
MENKYFKCDCEDNSCPSCYLKRGMFACFEADIHRTTAVCERCSFAELPPKKERVYPRPMAIPKPADVWA